MSLRDQLTTGSSGRAGSAAQLRHKASSGNKWNVPVGVTVSKMTKIGDVPVKFQPGIGYSVVKQDDFGQVAMIKLNIIPVIRSLIKSPLFGK